MIPSYLNDVFEVPLSPEERKWRGNYRGQSTFAVQTEEHRDDCRTALAVALGALKPSVSK
jgi:hypothetical protein